MSKLTRFRKWLTLEQAAKRLSVQLDEEVVPAEILQLYLDNALELGVLLTKSVECHAGYPVPHDKQPEQGEVRLNLSRSADYSLATYPNNKVTLGSMELWLGGWGAEHTYVKGVYQRMTGGSPVLDGGNIGPTLRISADPKNSVFFFLPPIAHSDGARNLAVDLFPEGTEIRVPVSSLLDLEARALEESGDGRSKGLAAKWPEHETEKLRALRMAAVRFWSNYDPNDPDTASKNEEVSEWLQTEYKGLIHKTLADSMATILRADGLKTGPRKK